MSELVNPDWPDRTIKGSSYLKGRIGWQGLRASEFIEAGPYLVTGTDLQRGHVNWDTCYHVSESRFREAGYIHVRDGDLLITKDGTIGKVAYARNCPRAVVLNSGIFLLRCIDGSYDHRFLYHLLSSDHFARFLRLNLNGSTIDHLYQYVFERFTFPVPDIEIQRRISAVLTTLDDQIEQTEALITKYQQIKAGLIHDLFMRGVAPDGRLRRPVTEAPECYKNSPIGWIPKEWDVVSASQLCRPITKGATPAQTTNQDSDNLIPFIRVQDLTFDGSLRLEGDSMYISGAVAHRELMRSRVYPKDVLMNIVGPPLGKVSLVSDEYPEYNINQAIAVYRPIQPEVGPYLKWYLLTNIAQRWFLDRAKRTSGQVNLTLEMCSQLLVPNPGRTEMQRIVSIADSFQFQVQEEVYRLEKLHRLRSGLMHDLLSGRVRVKLEETVTAT